MATKNYTTKTAAFSATRADMRQVAVSKKIEIGSGDTATQITKDSVSADDLLIGVDVEKDGVTTRERQSVKALIDKAQTDATNAAGIQVTRDLNGDYDNADAGEVLSVKTKKMNFYGTFVNVVQSTTNPDEISIYIGENNNPEEFNETITALVGDNTSRYIYSGTGYSTGSFKVDNSTTYKNTQQQSTTVANDTETLYGGASSSEEFTIPNKTTKITLEALQGDTVITSAQTEAIDGTKSTVTAKGKVGENDAITLTIKDIVENTPNDAKLGLTPGFLRCKIVCSVRNSYLLPDGGAYKVRLTVGEGDTKKTVTTGELFVWKADTRTPSVGEVKATYTSTGTRVVSGITYDTAARVAIEVKDVANTQFMQGSSKNRLKVTSSVTSKKADGKTANAAIAAVGSSGTLVFDTSGVSGSDKTTNSAVYSYTSPTDAAKISSSDTPCLITATVTAQACNANGGSVAGAAKTVSMTGQTNYFCDKENVTDNDAKIGFMNDGSRLGYTVLTDADGNVTGIDLTSSSTWTSSTDITNTAHALIQNGYLMHPKNDVTGKYTSATGTRYYTKLIKTGTAKEVKTSYVLSCPDGGLTASGVKIWAVPAQDGAGKEAGKFKHQLNLAGNPTSLSDKKIEITINPNTMTCYANSCFYLVIQIAEGTSKVGAITIS